MPEPAHGPGAGGGPIEPAAAGARVRPLRTWPALVLIVIVVMTRYGPGLVEGGASDFWIIGVFGPMLGSALVAVWWLAASRATAKERIVGLLGLGGSLALTMVLVEPAMGGPARNFLTIPMGMLGFAAGAVVLGRKRPFVRTGLALGLACAGFGFSILLRNQGMTGDYTFDFRWRWSKPPEALMLSGRSQPSATGTNSLDLDRIRGALANPEWPGFRGADRAGRARGPRLSTNWLAQAPRCLWRIQVGPAWSSFAVAGPLMFTQEQRGPVETVVCYEAESGREVWTRSVEGRLDDPMGGPGPRATPTLAGDGLFVTAATGTVLRLNPITGETVWRQSLTDLGGRAVPMWGFSASPLVAGSLVVVYAGGSGDKGLLGLDAATGAVRWSAAAGADSYSSPQLNRMAGEDLVLMLTNEGLDLRDPMTGTARLIHAWKSMAYRALQPTVFDGDIVLLPTPMNAGTRALRVTRSNDQFSAEVLWTSRLMKPDFTDFVIHDGHGYGIDGGVLTCVNLRTGERKWRDGRYGKGQVVLQVDSRVLLVAAETGQVAMVLADAEAYVEAGSFKALEGKTWNHPVVVGDRLYVRNAQEAACYQLPLAAIAALPIRP